MRELAAIVGEHKREDAPQGLLGPQGIPDEAEAMEDRGGGLVPDGKRQLEAGGPVVEREQALGVRLPPLDGVHLPGALAHVPRQPQELVVRPSRGVPGGASGKRVVAGLVGDLPPRVHVAHAGVPPVDPAVDGGLREPELRMGVDDLLGRDAAREAVPDDADLLLELPLVLVHAEPGLARGRVRRPLGHRSPVVDLRPDGAAVAATPLAAVAAPGPLSETRADLLQVPWGRVSVACPGRGHEAVAHGLVVDGRGGPADFVSDLPDRQVAVEAPLDGPPVRLGEARVRPPRPPSACLASLPTMVIPFRRCLKAASLPPRCHWCPQHSRTSSDDFEKRSGKV